MLQLAALPAERMRGARLVEDFRDALTVARNGWTKASLPVFDDGGTFDGIDDSITQPDILLGVNGVSFWITCVGATEQILELSATHSVTVIAGNVTATGPGWGGAAVIYVNGVETTAIGLGRSFVTIVTGTPFTANTIIVGRVGANFGAFKIERLAIWATPTVLTLAEHTAYYSQTMFNWRNRATVDLQLRMQDYDPTNVRTLDSSGHANHFTLGDGATATTFPTQQAGGMYFDNGDSLRLASMAQPTGAFSVCFVLNKSDFGVDYLGAHSDAAQTDLSWIIFRDAIGVWQFNVGSIATYVKTAANPDLTVKSLICTWDGSLAKIYVDGVYAVATTGGVPAQPAGAAQPMRIGQNTGGSNSYTGTIYDFKYFDGLALNAVQAADYHLQMMRTLGSEV